MKVYIYFIKRRSPPSRSWNQVPLLFFFLSQFLLWFYAILSTVPYLCRHMKVLLSFADFYAKWITPSPCNHQPNTHNKSWRPPIYILSKTVLYFDKANPAYLSSAPPITVNHGSHLLLFEWTTRLLGLYRQAPPTWYQSTSSVKPAPRTTQPP